MLVKGNLLNCSQDLVISYLFFFIELDSQPQSVAGLCWVNLKKKLMFDI